MPVASMYLPCCAALGQSLVCHPMRVALAINIGVSGALQLLREGLIFERLLLGHTSQKCFIMRNTSLLPAKWHIAGLEGLSPEFQIVPSSGELPARQEARITVEFTAQSKKDLADKLTLQVCHTWNNLIWITKTTPLKHSFLHRLPHGT